MGHHGTARHDQAATDDAGGGITADLAHGVHDRHEFVLAVDLDRRQRTPTSLPPITHIRYR